MSSVHLIVAALAAAAAVAAEPAPVAFDPARAAPYFSAGRAAAAAAKLRLEEYAAAATAFADYLKRYPRAQDRNQASFLLAYAELRNGNFRAASARFDELARTYPLLADYHALWAARARLALGEPEAALARARRVAASSSLDGEARILRAEAEARLGRGRAALAIYRGYLADYPQSWRASEVRFRTAQLLEATGEHAAAAAEYRRVYLTAPTEPFGHDAASHLGAVELTAAELAGRAAVLFDRMRNQESEAEWKRVLAAPGLTDQLTCTARFHAAQSVFKQRERPRAAPLFEQAVEACARAKDEDLTVKALYQAARSWGNIAERDPQAARRAVALFERVWREHPTHSYADDAMLRQAEIHDTLKEEARATELLAALPERFPGGDQLGEALWRLAFRALCHDQLDETERWLELELSKLPREEGWWEAGRTLYWLGRVAARKGAADRALERYQRAAREYPLSYYALLAINRLRLGWPEQSRAFIATLAADSDDVEGWRFRPRRLYGETGFRRGVELARLGRAEEARRELALAGIEVPSKRGATPRDAEEEELWWLAAVLYDRAGEFALSHFIPRHLLTSYARSYPVGPNRKRWKLAYPRAFAELIEKHAASNGQPAALEFAIVREESAFNPLLESFANAIGLTQLTAAPAARFAGGLPHDRSALHDPAINITIGARELGHVWQRYGGNPVLATAAYNAGEAPVSRWLRDRERAPFELDAFVEAIPYDETRGYTKRVLSSYFVYAWLWSDAQPSQCIPALNFNLHSH